MIFVRKTNEESYDYSGRCVLRLGVSITVPGSEGADGGEYVCESLMKLWSYVQNEAKESFLSRASERYDACVRAGVTFYPVRVSVDIHPLYTAAQGSDACPFSSKVGKRHKKHICATSGGCVFYEAVCRLFLRGRVTEKDRVRFAMRICDGSFCSEYGRRG